MRARRGGFRYLGSVQRAQGKPREAIASLERALAIDPEFALGHLELGLAHLDAGDLDEAVRILARSVALQPDDSQGHRGLGLALMRKGELEAAIAAFGRALELDPDDATSANSIAWVLATAPNEELRDPQKAVSLAQRAVELTPGNGDIVNTLGVALYRKGQWEECARVLESSVSLRRGGDPSDWLFLAMVYHRLGNAKAAHEWFRKALAWMEQNETTEEFLRFRAEAQALLGSAGNGEDG